MRDVADLLGRIFLAVLFIYEALDSIIFFDKTVRTMLSHHIDFYPNVLLGILIWCLIAGSILVLIGYYARFGALMLLLYWLPFTLYAYSFWNDPSHLIRINSLNFMRAMAISGGLLIMIANGAGKYSVRRLIYVMKLPK
jgi:putative oxidoreductase